MDDVPSIHNFETFPRKGSSIRKFIYNSFRVKKKTTNAAAIEKQTPSIYLVETTQSRVIWHSKPHDDFKPFFRTVSNGQMKECTLVKYFPAEGKAYDPHCKLTSFERKMRARQEFSEMKHCNLQLFCPEQASQIELRFTTSCVKEVVVRVIAPNGEVSDILHPNNKEPALFAPSKVGCGHGMWTIELAVREGIRFKFLSKNDFHLAGQGSLTYQVDHNYNLKLVEQLWLSFH